MDCGRQRRRRGHQPRAAGERSGRQFVPRVIQRIAAQASREVVEKWSGRLIPLASSVIGAGLNYYFVRAWGERARSHFRKRHMEMRSQMADGKLIVVSDAPKVLPS